MALARPTEGAGAQAASPSAQWSGAGATRSWRRPSAPAKSNQVPRLPSILAVIHTRRQKSRCAQRAPQAGGAGPPQGWSWFGQCRLAGAPRQRARRATPAMAVFEGTTLIVRPKIAVRVTSMCDCPVAAAAKRVAEAAAKDQAQVCGAGQRHRTARTAPPRDYRATHFVIIW